MSCRGQFGSSNSQNQHQNPSLCVLCYYGRDHPDKTSCKTSLRLGGWHLCKEGETWSEPRRQTGRDAPSCRRGCDSETLSFFFGHSFACAFWRTREQLAAVDNQEYMEHYAVAGTDDALYEQQVASQCNPMLYINIDSAEVTAVTPCLMGRLASAPVLVTPCVGCSLHV